MRMPTRTTADRHHLHRGWVLTAVCLAVFAINLDTTIVNVALPSLSRQLGAGSRDLQWVVDAYNLAFAALVLAGGSLGDRFGRRPMLMTGLLGFAGASALGATSSTSHALILARLVMGGFAALIYPCTLSILASVYPDRAERARAVGIWGAVTGLGVAVGPVTGGLLLSHLWWGSVFVALIPLALLAALLTFAFVPPSRRTTAPLDLPGLVVSTSTIVLLVATIIEAPQRGWASPLTVLGFGGTALLALLLVAVERRQAQPMLAFQLFRTPAFAAASAAVTVAFFALFGFIFLITQYLQLVRGYGTLATGVRILPVATAIAIGSIAGTRLASRVGTRLVVVTGLLVFGAAFAWIACSATEQPYPQIAVQMVLLGIGLGLTTAPATESILSVLPPDSAGVGSAVNDATREVGGTLGVAVIGSIATSVYLRHLDRLSGTELPGAVAGTVRHSLAGALAVARQAPPALALRLQGEITTAFMAGLHAGALVAAGTCLAGALAALALPGRPTRRGPSPDAGGTAKQDPSRVRPPAQVPVSCGPG